MCEGMFSRLQGVSVGSLLAQSYQPCTEVQYMDGAENKTLGLPSRPCKPLCQATYDACISVLSAAGLAYLVECNATDLDGDLYPANSTDYNLAVLGVGLIEISCNNPINTSTPAPLACIAPLFIPVGTGSNRLFFVAHTQTYRARCGSLGQKQCSGADVGCHPAISQCLHFPLPESAIQVPLAPSPS